MTLSEKILNLRKQKGMSQENLAEKLNVSRQAVSRWEMGSAQPDAANILQLSRLFGVTADYLLNDDYESDRDVPVVKKTELAANQKMKKMVGMCITAAGLLGNFVIYIFSRVIKVMVPSIRQDADGTKWYHWSSELMDYSYKYFVQTHNLEFLTAMFWGFVVVGLLIVFVKKEDFIKRKDKIKIMFAKKK